MLYDADCVSGLRGLFSLSVQVLTPSYHAENYSPDDNRYDHRQFLYNVRYVCATYAYLFFVERTCQHQHMPVPVPVSGV